MKKYFLVLLIYTGITSNAQISLEKKYSELINAITSANDVVIKATYNSKPLAIYFTKEASMTEYYKTVLFNNNICISEHQLYPLSQFELHFDMNKLKYGTPRVEYMGGTKVYIWEKNGLSLSMAKRESRFSGKVVTWVIYSMSKYDKDLIYITEIMNSGLTETEIVKME